MRHVARELDPIPFSGAVAAGPDGTGTTAELPHVSGTVSTIRVGSTESRIVAVLVAHAFGDRPAPDPETLDRWDSEPEMTAELTREWQCGKVC